MIEVAIVGWLLRIASYNTDLQYVLLKVIFYSRNETERKATNY